MAQRYGLRPLRISNPSCSDAPSIYYYPCMGQYDDDEQRAAYERARDYAAFADIVQHFDDTARGNHDDIDFDDIDHDGTEYDDNGNLVIPIDLADFIAANPAIGIIIAVCDSIDQFGTGDDDYEFGGGDQFYESVNYDSYCHHEPTIHRLYRGSDSPVIGSFKPFNHFYGWSGERFDSGSPDSD